MGEQNIYYQVAAFAILFLNLICSEKVEFDLLTQSPGEVGGGGGLLPKYLLPCCCIL